MNTSGYSVAVAAAMAFACTSANAESFFQIEAGIGVSTYRTQGDNVWYQQGQPHTLGLSAPVLALGLTGPIYSRESWGIDWHANYVSLGHVSSDCTCTPMDENYSTRTHSKLNLYDVQDAQFVGNGNAQGVTLTLEPYFKYRGWRLGIEGGLFIYRPAWDIKVYNWSPRPGVAPTTIEAHTPRNLQLGKVIGVSVGRGNLSVAYQHYFLPTRFDSNHYPAIWKGADVLMMKYKF
jgi:hypothetical protein